MKMKIKNPLAVNENDTLGTAILKGAVEGYIKGTLAAGLGLGVLALTGLAISKMDNSKKEEEKLDEELKKKTDEEEQETEETESED